MVSRMWVVGVSSKWGELGQIVFSSWPRNARACSTDSNSRSTATKFGLSTP